MLISAEFCFAQRGAETPIFLLFVTAVNAIVRYTALAHESVDPGVLFDKNTRGRKSRETLRVHLRSLDNFYRQN
jgi:hypothetical protein